MHVAMKWVRVNPSLTYDRRDHLLYRMYLNVYVPRLQVVEGVLGFIRRHRGYPVASTRMVEPITRRFVAAIEQLVRDHGIPLVSFEKGRKEAGWIAGCASIWRRKFW
jgi:hypothetical protein